MQSWQSSFLGLRAIPRDLGAFELHAFFTFDAETFEQLAQCELHKEARLFVAQCDNGLRPDAFEFDLTAPARFFRPPVIADNALRPRPRALPDVEAVVVLSFDGYATFFDIV